MHVGEKLRQFRLNQKPKKLTLEAMGEKLGYSHVYVSDIERGKVEPSREFIKKLAEVYGLSWDFLYGDAKPKEKEFIARIEVTDKDRRMIEQTEGTQYLERFVPIPIAKGKISGGPPRVIREDPEGVAVIYRDWARSSENFTAVWMKGDSMEKTIPDGSLVGIDHSKKDIRELNGKIVAIRKNDEATIKRLKIVSKGLVFGIPDNIDRIDDLVILREDEINGAIVGKVAWWWGKQG